MEDEQFKSTSCKSGLHWAVLRRRKDGKQAGWQQVEQSSTHNSTLRDSITGTKAWNTRMLLSHMLLHKERQRLLRLPPNVSRNTCLLERMSGFDCRQIGRGVQFFGHTGMYLLIYQVDKRNEVVCSGSRIFVGLRLVPAKIPMRRKRK